MSKVCVLIAWTKPLTLTRPVHNRTPKRRPCAECVGSLALSGHTDPIDANYSTRSTHSNAGRPTRSEVKCPDPYGHTVTRGRPQRDTRATRRAPPAAPRPPEEGHSITGDVGPTLWRRSPHQTDRPQDDPDPAAPPSPPPSPRSGAPWVHSITHSRTFGNFLDPYASCWQPLGG